MNNISKRLFCKHSWEVIRRQNMWFGGDYGCVKCGKVAHVRYEGDKVWRFNRKMKGNRSMTKIELLDGKYTVIHDDGRGLHALRHGGEWRNLAGDDLVLTMAQEIEELREELLRVESLAVVNDVLIERNNRYHSALEKISGFVSKEIGGVLDDEE